MKTLRPVLFGAAAACVLSAGVAAAMDFGPFGWFRMMSGSMEPTVSEGDVITSDRPKFICSESDVNPGDVVFYHKSPDAPVVYMHRAVAGPGSTVEMRNGELLIDGHAVATKIIGPTTFRDIPVSVVRETLPDGVSYQTLRFRDDAEKSYLQFRNFGPKKVPAGEWFILGDNRDDAMDSRANGFVPLKRICAVAQSIAASDHKDRVGRRP